MGRVLLRWCVMLIMHSYNILDHLGVHGLASSASPVHNLLLCRHGDSIWNGGQAGYVEKFTGWTDIPLSPKGVYEAIEAGQVASTYVKTPDIVFTSILNRAQESTRYLLTSLLENNLNDMSSTASTLPVIEDFRLNERHYGALQGYTKKDVEDGVYGHDAELVKLWRRSWHVVPPLLTDDDPRRQAEIQQYAKKCGGAHRVPRGESLEMVAQNRVRPFLDQVVTPCLNQIASKNNNPMKSTPATGMIVAHANSLRALIGVICEVEENPAALQILEALRIPTGVPLVLSYRQLSCGKYQVMDLPTAEECLVEYWDGPGLAQHAPPDLGHPLLPVWPLNSCIPIRNMYTYSNFAIPQEQEDVVSATTRLRRP